MTPVSPLGKLCFFFTRPGRVQAKFRTPGPGRRTFAKLLGVVLGPISAEELVSVAVAPSARFARYEIKINILTCLWFYV